jgi:hypothetical protein
MNWRGRPLVSHQVILELIANTTTTTGLTVRCTLDTGQYPTGIKYTDKDIAAYRCSATTSTETGTTRCTRATRRNDQELIRRGHLGGTSTMITRKIGAVVRMHLSVHNDKPKPFIWTATADAILEKVRRGRVALNQAVNQ